MKQTANNRNKNKQTNKQTRKKEQANKQTKLKKKEVIEKRRKYLGRKKRKN